MNSPGLGLVLERVQDEHRRLVLRGAPAGAALSRARYCFQPFA
jgi:hypothetical protein